MTTSTILIPYTESDEIEYYLRHVENQKVGETSTRIRRSPEKFLELHHHFWKPSPPARMDDSHPASKQKRRPSPAVSIHDSFRLGWFITFAFLGYFAFYYPWQHQMDKSSSLGVSLALNSSQTEPPVLRPLSDVPKVSDQNSKHAAAETEEDSDEDDDDEDSDEDDNDHSRDASRPQVVHIIHTRFMQHQPELIDLGMARLKLFKAFFLQSLQQQTWMNFVCIIKTDPNLSPQLKEALLETLDSLPFRCLVVATNENPHSQYWSIMNSSSKEASKNNILSGDLVDVQNYLRQSNRVLETRLDVDDGLNTYFMNDIQRLARGHFDTYQTNADKSKSWKVWCASTHLEWQMASLSSKSIIRSTDNNNNNATGTLISIRSHTCVSAGLTVAFIAPNATKPSFPTINKHTKVHQNVPFCEKKKKDQSGCFEFLPLVPTALRARTPTSAGMYNVVWDNSTDVGDNKRRRSYLESALKQQKEESKLWKAAQHYFGLSRDTANIVHDYIGSHMKAIALDNLKGQCSSGHSCKESSRQLLKALVEAYTNN